MEPTKYSELTKPQLKISQLPEDVINELQKMCEILDLSFPGNVNETCGSVVLMLQKIREILEFRVERLNEIQKSFKVIGELLHR